MWSIVCFCFMIVSFDWRVFWMPLNRLSRWFWRFWVVWDLCLRCFGFGWISMILSCRLLGCPLMPTVRLCAATSSSRSLLSSILRVIWSRLSRWWTFCWSSWLANSWLLSARWLTSISLLIRWCLWKRWRFKVVLYREFFKGNGKQMVKIIYIQHDGVE